MNNLIYSVHFQYIQKQKRKKREKNNSLRWHFRCWMVFLILLHLSFTIIASYIPMLAFFSFLFLSHCIYIIDTRITKKKIPKIEKEDTKKAFSNFIYEKNAIWNWKQFIFCILCAVISIFLLSYIVNWYRNEYEVCWICCGDVCEPPQIEHHEALTAIIIK